MADELTERANDGRELSWRVDQACDRFEAAWQRAGPNGERPDIDAFVADLPAPARPRGLRELIALDAFYRRAAGDVPRAAEYARYAADLEAGWVDALICPPTVSRVRGDGPAATRSERVPGSVVAGRYRIVALLGRGGMGEVYRADDLKLGQSVALKFSPDELARSPQRLARFHHEVRVARQVSHPNVCRVHDIAEVDGQPFLTMEYIDGQDLAALLRQVGRLPEDTGIQLARQLCLGLAAAHEKGVIHRDLKPHNIMIDGRGRVRITDFGLAGFAHEWDAADLRAGTPAYMAPEHLAGKEITLQSDLFALGLIFYEMFTGKRAFPARSAEELRQLYERDTPSLPSSLVNGLSPAVEQVILRCLRPTPCERPRSAVAVAAALPGGDPLGAALAAGETPSPQMIADAGGLGGLNPWTGLALLVATVAGVVLVAWLNEQAAVFARAGLDLSPRELVARSRSILRQLGYSDATVDTAYALATDYPLLEQVSRETVSASHLPLMYFWYRQSPSLLVQSLTPDALGWGMPGRVTPSEPPFREPGMTCLFLDPRGRLLEFHAVPPRELPGGNPEPVEWETLLRETGLALPLLEDAPQRTPPNFAGEPRAWVGSYPDQPGVRVRVEAASCRGRPVYFFVGTQNIPERLHATAIPKERGAAFYDNLYTLIGVGTLTIGALLAWRNWRSGRANVRGACTIGLCLFVTALVGWALTAHHTLSPGAEQGMLAAMTGAALLNALTIGLVYLGVEPSIRRQRPWQAIGWNRLLEGRWRDPWVGRDVLAGALVGVLACPLLDCLWTLLPVWTGRAQPQRIVWDVTFTEGAGTYLLLLQFELLTSLRDVFLFFVLTLLLRRTWIAAGVWLLLMTLPMLLHAEDPVLQGPLMLLCWAINLMLLFRFGLLAYTVSWVCGGLLKYLPITTDLSAWHAPVGLGGMLVVIVLAFHGFNSARAGRSLFRPEFFADV